MNQGVNPALHCAHGALYSAGTQHKCVRTFAMIESNSSLSGRCDRHPEELLRLRPRKKGPDPKGDAMKKNTKKPRVRVEHDPGYQPNQLAVRASIAALKALPTVLRLLERHGWL